MRLPAFSLLLLLAYPLAAAKKPVTVDALMDVRPSSMVAPVWSPDGRRFLFQHDGQVRLYDVTARTDRAVLTLKELEAKATKVDPPDQPQWQNRRVQESRVQWAPDGQHLLLAAGGDLFWHDLAKNETQPLTQTPFTEADAKLSPDGKLVSFRRGHELYTLDLATRQAAARTSDATETRWNAELDWVYPEELDLGTAHWWSPDSRAIAYLQFDVSREFLYPQADLLGARAKAEPERYPHAGTPNATVKLMVLTLTDGQVRSLPFGGIAEPLVARVYWTPDARALVVQTFNRVQNRQDVVLTQADGSGARLLWRETDPAWVNLADDLRFLHNGDLLWTSERDGFRHLYVHGKDGARRKQLTEGAWEVQDVLRVDEDGGWVYFSGTKDSPMERHVYRVRLDGFGLQRLTQGAGTHTASFAPRGDAYLDSFSSLHEPPRQTLHRLDGTLLSTVREANRRVLDEYDLAATELMDFADEAGTRFYARLTRPANFQPGRQYPAVVIVYGGPHGQAIRNAWPGLGLEQLLAHRGFAVWQMDNRGTNGRGHAFSTLR